MDVTGGHVGWERRGSRVGRPDLRMANPTSFSIERTSSGARRLRFSTRIVNMGAGPFELHGW